MLNCIRFVNVKHEIVECNWLTSDLVVLLCDVQNAVSNWVSNSVVIVGHPSRREKRSVVNVLIQTVRNFFVNYVTQHL